MTFKELTIVTSCVGYGKYLTEWAQSIIDQGIRPGRVCIFTHGTEQDYLLAETAMLRLVSRGISCYHAHSPTRLDFGVARNRAVELAETEWVMHLDADDMLCKDALADLRDVASTADVVQAGYERINCTSCSKKVRLYAGADGIDALKMTALASGNSMFKRSLWEARPYRTDLFGAWDTALWIGFAYLGARFRPSTRPVFKYRQHHDSLFNTRRASMGWSRVHTDAMLKSLRRNDSGVNIIVPRDLRPSPERKQNWDRVLRHYREHHPEWQIVEGYCHTVKWVKGAAILDALNRSTADVIVIADADVMVHPDALRASVTAVMEGAAWSMPHRFVHRADRESTLALNALPELMRPMKLDRTMYEGVPGGGIVVVRHVNYRAVGGIPLAFQGWGSEDKCLALICDKLLGPCVRGDADLIHLWHPPQSGAGMGNKNVQMLQALGYAALKGNDQLVQALNALPKPSMGVHQVAPRERRVGAIDTHAIAQRMEQRRLP